jgi:outer membrane receptor protein involved in Fe transport
VRFSYQTAYRFPSTQQQWIDLFVGSGRLIGENRAIWEKYNLIENAPYDPTSLGAGQTPVRLPYVQTKPESVTSFELGYKALIKNKLLLDMYGYFGQYQDFLSRRDAIQFPGGVPAPTGGTGYSIVVNTPQTVETLGWGISADYLLSRGYRIGVNASGDYLQDVPAGYRAFFNSPGLRTNLLLSNDGVNKKKNIGFSIAWRWQESIFYESDFVQGDLPSMSVVDASVSFKATAIKSLIKIGANNLLNSYYRTAVANPSIGGLYYVSFAYNVL